MVLYKFYENFNANFNAYFNVNFTLGSEDRTLSISNVEGDTLRVATLRAEPSDVQFSEMKQVQFTTSIHGKI